MDHGKEKQQLWCVHHKTTLYDISIYVVIPSHASIQEIWAWVQQWGHGKRVMTLMRLYSYRYSHKIKSQPQCWNSSCAHIIHAHCISSGALLDEGKRGTTLEHLVLLGQHPGRDPTFWRMDMAGWIILKRFLAMRPSWIWSYPMAVKSGWSRDPWLQSPFSGALLPCGCGWLRCHPHLKWTEDKDDEHERKEQ